MKRVVMYFEGHRFRKLLLMAAVVALGAAVQGWAAAQWPQNFDSDEAIFGLMARHVQRGEFVPTVYGTEHLGSIESVVAAGSFSLFGESVTALRVGSVLLYAIFLILLAILVNRWFGYPVALVSLLMLALPGFHVLSWTYKPIGAYGTLLVLGTAMIFLSQVKHKTDLSRTLAAGGLGILIGLGMWSNQMIVVYVAALGIVAFLASPEWNALYARLEALSQEHVHIPLRELLPVVVLGAAGIGVLAFFSSGCQPVWQFEKVESIARAVLAVLGLALGLSALRFSNRRTRLVMNGGALALGTGVGYSPMLFDWLVNGNSPVSVIRKSCPTNAVTHIELLVKEILPGIWGIPTLGDLVSLPASMVLLWAGIIGLVCIALVAYVWRHRTELWRLLAFSPLDGPSQPYLVVALLLVIPVVLSVFGSNTVDVDSARHLLVTAEASSVVFALFLIDLSRRSPKAGIPILVFWIFFVGLTNLNYSSQHWPIKFSRYDPDRVAILESYLRDGGATEGFADYWGAFTLDFITAERITLAPYNGLNRYPPYTRAVKAAPVRAFVFPLSNSPAPGGELEDLIAFLQQASPESGEGAAFPWITDLLRSQSVLDRRAVADWDVWIVAER
jgi:hypothetical protein